MVLVLSGKSLEYLRRIPTVAVKVPETPQTLQLKNLRVPRFPRYEKKGEFMQAS